MKKLTILWHSAFKRFLRQKTGIIAIEAALMLTVFVTIIALIIDLGSAFVLQSRLERATYTGATVLRERIALYNDLINNDKTLTHNASITQEEVDQLRDIINQLMSRDDLVVIVDELQFTLTPGTPNKKSEQRLTAAGSPTTSCQSTLPDIETYKAMSPWSNRKRWLPLYRVTVCIPGQTSWFKSIVNESSATPGLAVKELIAFNVVIPR